MTFPPFKLLWTSIKAYLGQNKVKDKNNTVNTFSIYKKFQVWNVSDQT